MESRSCEVYISGMQPDISEENLKNLCKKTVGEDVIINKLMNGKKSRKATVTFSTEEEANKFIKKFNYLGIIDSENILKVHKIKFEGVDKNPENAICVKFTNQTNIEEITERFIYRNLSEFGEIVKITLIHSKINQKLRFALVTFGETQSAKAALEKRENELFIFEKKKPVQNIEIEITSKKNLQKIVIQHSQSLKEESKEDSESAAKIAN